MILLKSSKRRLQASDNLKTGSARRPSRQGRGEQNAHICTAGLAPASSSQENADRFRTDDAGASPKKICFGRLIPYLRHIAALNFSAFPEKTRCPCRRSLYRQRFCKRFDYPEVILLRLCASFSFFLPNSRRNRVFCRARSILRENMRQVPLSQVRAARFLRSASRRR